jgi:hypothetical protein
MYIMLSQSMYCYPLRYNPDRKYLAKEGTKVLVRCPNEPPALVMFFGFLEEERLSGKKAG